MSITFAGSGVSTDIWTSYAARIMAVSVVPFLLVQLPQLMSSTSGRHLAVLIALVVSLLLLIAYCVYQVNVFLWSNYQHVPWSKLVILLNFLVGCHESLGALHAYEKFDYSMYLYNLCGIEFWKLILWLSLHFCILSFLGRVNTTLQEHKRIGC